MEIWYEIEINLNLTLSEENWKPILHQNKPAQWKSLTHASTWRNVTTGFPLLLRSRIVKVEGEMVEKSREVCLQ